MKHTSSTWNQDVEIQQFPALREDIEIDVAIIGGGITGITTAYLLSKTGLRIALIEKNRLAHGATVLTTAFVTQYIDTDASDLVPMFGKESARAILESHAKAIDQMEVIVKEENISCEFQRCSNYIVATLEKHIPLLHEEKDAAKTLGVSMEFRTDKKLGFSNLGYLELRHQAKFHPLKYLAHLTKLLASRNVEIFERTEVTDMKHGDIVTLTTPSGTVKAKQVVVATYAPFNKELFFKKAFYDTYVLEASLPKGAMAEGTYEDMISPYHYFRVDSRGEHDRLIIGGEDHRTDIPVNDEKAFQSLEDHVHAFLKDIPHTITRRWQGPIVESVDGLAWIGTHGQDNVFYATGFSGNGMTYSMIASQVIADAIQRKENPWTHLYRTKRIPTLGQLMVKGRDYSKELIGGALKSLFVTTRK